ncbi:WD repeat-containing protein 11-like [Crassostrea virginica]
MTLSPKIITTSSHPQNRGACDWGWPGQVAYGSHTYLVVADLNSSQVTQVLGVHKGNVTSVKWKPEDTHHDVVVNPYTLTLAAGDTHGDVTVWNVTKGEVKSKFGGTGKPVRDLTWITNQETSEATLLVLYNKSDVIMWDFLTSSQLWKTSFPEPLSSICIDPFNKSKAIFLCEDSTILLLDDLQPKEAPSQKYRQISFYGSKGPMHETLQTTEESGRLRRNSSSLNKFLNMTTSLITGSVESKSSKKSISEEDKAQQCLQVVFHPGIRHMVFMVYSAQVDIIDIDVCIVMSTIRLDLRSSYFVRIFPCHQKDVLYCLHENTCITIRVRREDTSHCTYTENMSSAPTTPSTPITPEYGETISDKSDITYDLIWQSDAVRLSNQSTVYGFCVHPGSEASAALIFSDGKILHWELVKTRTNSWLLKDIVPKLSRRGQNAKMSDECRFLLTGMIKGFPSPVYTTKSNLLPHVTIVNDPTSKPQTPLMALGLDNGNIIILNTQTGQIEREFSVHFNTVKGIEWVNQKTLLSWTCSKSGSSGSLGRNEVLLTTISSGIVENFRQRHKIESLITDMKVSPLRQYVVIAFKSQPLEVWCLQTKNLLRELPAGCQQPRALTWAPLCSWKTVVRKRSQKLVSKDISDMSKVDIQNLLHDMEKKQIAKEQCVLADRDGTICRITLEERSIADLTIFPPEVNGMSSITHIAMKDDILMLGDVTGTLCLWNLTEKTLKSVPRSGDKPYTGLKTLLFHPESKDHRFAVLYDQGVDVWLFSQSQDQLKLLRSWKNSKYGPKVSDVEWADLNHICMVMDDGSIHVVDIASPKVTCTWNQRNQTNAVFCPQTLPAQAAMVLKHLLQNASSTTMECVLTPDRAKLKESIDDQINQIDRDTLDFLTSDNVGTGQRCLLTARLFGDEFDVNFWTKALYFIQSSKHDHANDQSLVSIENDPTFSSIEGVFEHKRSCRKKHACSQRTPLDCLQSQTCFMRQQLHRVEQHNKKRTTEQHRRTCIEHFIMMGRVEEATKILLETDFQSGSYREDYLQACLLSCDRTNTTAQSTLKLVATHLIISGKLQEGVETLCLLDKVLDACRYLQTYDEWQQAAWLAKLVLNDVNCEEIYVKWIEHLLSTKNMLQAIFVMLSIGKFDQALRTLDYIGYTETAVCFIKVCQESGVKLPKDEVETILEKRRSDIERLGLMFTD